jgi:hypothetical protein
MAHRHEPVADSPLLDRTAQKVDIPLTAFAAVGRRTTNDSIEPGAFAGARSITGHAAK